MTPSAPTPPLAPDPPGSDSGPGVLIEVHNVTRHFEAGRVRALVQDMEWVGSELMRFLLRDYRNGTGEKNGPEEKK